MYTAVYTLASDGHVGRSRVRNPAPLYFFSCFMFSFLCFPFCLSTRPWRLCALLVCLFTQQCTRLLLMELFLIHPKRRVWNEVLQSGSRLQLCCAPVTRDTPRTCNHHLRPPRCPNAQNTKCTHASPESSLAAGSSFASPCLLYTSPSPRDKRQSRMPSSA